MKKLFSSFTLHCIVVLAAASLFSCDALKRQAVGAYNMTKCDYDFRSLTNLSVAGVDPLNMTLLDAPKLLGLLSGGATSIPVKATVNLDVHNPNSTEALLNGLDYVLSIDGIDFTAGSVSHQLSVMPGQRGSLPLDVMFDVATFLKGESRDAVTGIVKNLMGMGTEPSKVTLGIRPSFMVAGRKVTSPIMIPVNFTFGGKK